MNKILVYIILSIVNLSIGVYFATNKLLILLFELVLVYTQLILLNSSRQMLGLRKPLPHYLSFIMKISRYFALGGVLLYTVSYAKENIPVLLGMYIFQLIILVLSIKRESKKN